MRRTCVVRQEPAMTLLERLPSAPVLPAPVLATARLRLRAPQREDASAIAALANDRRIAENTAHIPHPYTLADAESFLRYLKESETETAFAITLAGALIGVCGVRVKPGQTPEIGSSLGP